MFKKSKNVKHSLAVKPSVAVKFDITKNLTVTPKLGANFEFEQKLADNSKFELSEFENNEVNSIIYFTSQIYNFDEAYFIIEYKNFEISKINFYFNNIKNKNFDDVVDIISKLIEISDSSINTATSHKIVINMMNKFKDSKYNVTLIYNNSLTYSLTIKNNNGLEFSIS